MLKLFFNSLKISAANLSILLFKPIWVWAALILISGSMTVMTDAVTSDREIQGTMTMVLSLLVAVCVELIVGMVVTIVVSFTLNKQIGSPSTQPKSLVGYLRPLTIEGLRSLSRILMWSLALILPGLFQMVKLSFVNYVVLFDPRYQAGQVDALEESGIISYGVKRYLALIMISGFGLEFASDWLRKSVFEPGIMITFVAVALRLACEIYLQGTSFALFKQKSKV